MRLKIFMLLSSCIISNYAFAMHSSDGFTDDEYYIPQSVIMKEKEFDLIPYKNEEELSSLLTSHFDLTNSLNILDDSIKYDEDKLKYVRKKTGLNIAKIDKRVGRIVLEYEGALGYGTGSFLNNKIVTNAHVLHDFPYTKEVFFEQGLSLVLQEEFNVDAVVNGLNKHKKAFLNSDLYQENRVELEHLLQPEVISRYEPRENANLLEGYFYNIKNADIGCIDDFKPCKGYKDWSHYSFNYNSENDWLLSWESQKAQLSQKVFKLTHYPLGIPVQRTSYGVLEDVKKRWHRMSTLGGSSGSLVLDYHSQPIGMHSSGWMPYYENEVNELTVSEKNLYQTLSSFKEESVYLSLHRDLPSRVVTYFKKNNIIKSGLVKGLPFLIKKKIKLGSK